VKLWPSTVNQIAALPEITDDGARLPTAGTAGVPAFETVKPMTAEVLLADGALGPSASELAAPPFETVIPPVPGSVSTSTLNSACRVSLLINVVGTGAPL